MIGRNVTPRFGAVVAVAALAIGLSAGCSSEGADVSCNLNTCTVTFDRGVEAEASVLGVSVKLVSVENDLVTLDVSGNEIVLPAGDTDQQTQAGGLNVSIQEVTADKVVLEVTQA
ncbi:MAG: hypothetical protein JXA67_15990 [Micromonosporaceae bacterium]|nr:hypothetical protein [Micromonosporaceae bacterium]